MHKKQRFEEGESGGGTSDDDDSKGDGASAEGMESFRYLITYHSLFGPSVCHSVSIRRSVSSSLCLY